MSPRKKGLAFLHTHLSVGLGQLYNGELKKAGLFLGVQYLAAIGLIFGYQSFSVLVTAALFGLTVYLLNLVQAVRSAGAKKNYQLQSFNRWYYYLLYIVLFSFILPGLLNVNGTYVEAFKIPSSSMVPTLQIGDHFIVDKSWYRDHSPERGEIAIYQLPDEGNVTVIKRVVAVGGDTVQLRGTKLILNGVETPEPYASYIHGGLKDFPSTKVPDGHVFLLGDNRDASKDSRYYADKDGTPRPFLRSEELKGKGLYIYFTTPLEWKRIGVPLK